MVTVCCKIYIVILIFIILVLYNCISKKENYSNYIENIENNFKIIITTYNPGIKLFKKCLESVEVQKYKNYQVCIVNDASTKNSDEILELCEEYYQKYGWLYVNLKKNVGPCEARDIAINNLNPEPNDIIVAVDGDDELYDDMVLNKVNYYYQDTKLLITFGNFVKQFTNGTVSDKKKIRIRKVDIQKVINNRSYRKKVFIFSHLKTFKYKLYEKINHDDLKKDGEYFRSATDVAIMFPMLEMAGDNVKFINLRLYKYTYDHNESFHNNKKKRDKQKKNEIYLRKLPKYDVVDFEEVEHFGNQNKLKIVLITQLYETNLERYNEMIKALRNNINNKFIEKIYLLNEKKINLDSINSENKIKQIIIKKRLTYKKAIDFSANTFDSNTIVILCNSDIWFDNTLKKITNYNLNDTVITLSRYNIKEDNSYELFNVKYSQDSWIFKNPLKLQYNYNFELGTPGCDNRIAWVLKNSKKNGKFYNVLNPALTIKSYHEHKNNFRNYNRPTIPKPYYHVPVTY